MALTLSNFVGFESGGLEEATQVNGSGVAVQSTIKRTDGFALKLDTGTTGNYVINAFDQGLPAPGGDDYVVGFAVRFSDVSPDAAVVFAGANGGIGTTSLNTPIWRMRLAADGDLEFLEGGGSQTVVATVTTPFTVDTFHYIELVWATQNVGDFEIFIDGVTAASGTGDFLVGLDFETVFFLNESAANTDIYFDDFYVGSAATDATDFLDQPEVFSYRSNKNSATPDDGGADLDTGTWLAVQATPFSSSVAAVYDATNAAGAVDTDDVGGSEGTGGPSTDTRINGTIVAAKYTIRAERTNGQGSAHHMLIGNDVDGTTRSADLGLGAAASTNEFLSTSATIVPTTSEFLRLGFEKIGGARDIEVYGMMANILHAPSAPHTASGNPSLTPVEAAGTTLIHKAASGTPSLTPVDAAGTALVHRAASGAATLAAAIAAGTAQIVTGETASGAATLTVVEAAGTALVHRAASGASSLTPVESTGTALVHRAASGDATLTTIESAGTALVHRAASGGATLTTVEGAGTALVHRAASGDATLTVIEAAGTATVITVANGTPSLEVVEAAGTALVHRAASGTPALIPVEAAGTALVHRAAAGAAILAAIEAAGTATIAGGETASGAATLTEVESSGTALVHRAATGDATLTEVVASGTALVHRAASGGASITEITASGTALVHRAASGAAEITTVEAAGTALVHKAASGDATLAVVEASGTATVITVANGTPSLTAVEAAGTALVHRAATGAATLTVVEASGTALVHRAANGTVTMSVVTAAGTAIVNAEDIPFIVPGRRHIAPFIN